MPGPFFCVCSALAAIFPPTSLPTAETNKNRWRTNSSRGNLARPLLEVGVLESRRTDLAFTPQPLKNGRQERGRRQLGQGAQQPWSRSSGLPSTEPEVGHPSSAPTPSRSRAVDERLENLRSRVCNAEQHTFTHKHELDRLFSVTIRLHKGRNLTGFLFD